MDADGARVGRAMWDPLGMEPASGSILFTETDLRSLQHGRVALAVCYASYTHMSLSRPAKLQP